MDPLIIFLILGGGIAVLVFLLARSGRLGDKAEDRADALHDKANERIRRLKGDE